MKLLYVTSQSGRRINGFMRSAIIAARQLNIDFTIVSNMDHADKQLYEEDCRTYGIKAEHIDCDRNPLAKKNYTLAKKQLLDLMKREKYDVVHCNTPIGGVLGRICAKEAKIPYVIYQAHGFHFWQGAPLKNWICYYPVERILAHYTDLLITINNEDYIRAQKFHLRRGGRVVKVPGVGVDVKKFSGAVVDAGEKLTFFRRDIVRLQVVQRDHRDILSALIAAAAGRIAVEDHIEMLEHDVFHVISEFHNPFLTLSFFRRGLSNP